MTNKTQKSTIAGPAFLTTEWSVVLQAGQDKHPGATQALESLCRTYWPPLYAYARRQGLTPHDAQDVTQEFIAHLLRRSDLATVSPDKGRFRSFLLGALKNFLVSRWRTESAQKRGGQVDFVQLESGAAEQLCAQLAEQLRHLKPSVVAAPALGGVLVAYEVARALGVRAIFTERQDGAMTLRRGFTLEPDEPTLVVEDVITTGLSTRETIQCIEQAGGKVVGAGSLIDRSGGTADLVGLPKASLVNLKIQNYNPAECPLCQAGIPAIKPGSRAKK